MKTYNKAQSILWVLLVAVLAIIVIIIEAVVVSFVILLGKEPK